MAATGIQIGIDPRPAQTGAAAVNRAILDIRNSVTGMRNDIQALARASHDGFTQMGRDAQQTAATTNAALQRNTAGINQLISGYRTLRNSLPVIALIALTRELIQNADAYTNMTSKIRLVTQSQEELGRVQQSIFTIAQETRTGLGATVELYTRMARSTRDLGLSQERVANITKTVNQAIQVGGSTATEAANGVIQLGQALASGALRGDELRSILEQMPRLAIALAQGLGVSVGQLRKLGEAGELTTSRIIEALEKEAPKIAVEFGKMTPTISSSFTLLGNSLTRIIGKLNEATGAGVALAGAIKGVADAASSPTSDKALSDFGSGWSTYMRNVKQQASTGPAGTLFAPVTALGGTVADLYGSYRKDQAAQARDADARARGFFPARDPSAGLRGRGASILAPVGTDAIGGTVQNVQPRFDWSLDELRQLEEQRDERNFQRFLDNIGNNTAAQRRAGIGTNIGPTINPNDTTRVIAGTAGAQDAYGEAITKKVEDSIRQSEVGLDQLEEHARRGAANIKNEYGGFFDYAKQSIEDLRNVNGTFFTDFTEGLAQMVASGKLNFKSFAQSIISELIRIEVRAIIVRAILSFFGGGGATGVGAVSGGSGVGSLTGATAGYAASGTSLIQDNTIVGEEGMETLQRRNNAGARIMNNKETRKLLQGLQSQDAMPESRGQGGDQYIITVEQHNSIQTTGVTADEVQGHVARGMEQAVNAAVSKVQHRYSQGRL